MKTAWVFPGQGSQAVGMGADLLEIPGAKAKFEQAAEILGWSVPDLCQGDADKLSRTLYTQPCLYVVETILVDLALAQGQQPALVAGHSLGEYVALYAAQVFEFEVGLKLVKRRAELMDAASGGKMVALIGFDRSQLDALLAQTPDVVLANDNSDAQVVLSGTVEAVDSLLGNLKVKRAIPLQVSGAFHSPLMADAAQEFQQVLEPIAFAPAQALVLSNVDPSPTQDAALLKDRLNRQITGQVRWREIALQLPALGVERVVEIGPGKVLTGLIKRAAPDLTLLNISSAEDLKSLQD